MNNKKVFRMPIISVIGFRFAIILFSVLLFGCVEILVRSIIEKNIVGIFGVAFMVGLYACCFKMYFIPVAFPLGFGKLIVSDEGVEYHCLLTKKIFLSWDECESCGIEGYKNVVKDVYGTGRVYIYFSKNELEPEFRDNIIKKKNSADFIKFFPVTAELCEEILRHKKYSEIRRFIVQKSFGKR